MLALRGIFKRFGRVRALRGVDLSIDRGEVVGLLGPNGAGKSTSIRILTGFMPPDRGEIVIDGIDALRDARSARTRLGYLPESAPFYPEMSVRGYLHYRGRLHAMDRRERKAGIERVLDRCRLTDVGRRRIGQLSKGYRRRVGIAAALLHDPPILVLDEPTDGLDPGQVQQTRSLVRELGADRTMLVSSHILPEVEQMCTRVAVLAGGRLAADGTPEALIRAHGGLPAYAAEAKVEADELRRRLSGVVGVERVEVEQAMDGWARAHVVTKRDAPDRREAIGAALAGLSVRELRAKHATLETVFLNLVEREQEGEA